MRTKKAIAKSVDAPQAEPRKFAINLENIPVTADVPAAEVV
ncbi:hypothetical protein [Hymenobacter sp. ISL-91]|nr:hypothetical protein [Hymenobacter sp. ISL-91]